MPEKNSQETEESHPERVTASMKRQRQIRHWSKEGTCPSSTDRCGTRSLFAGFTLLEIMVALSILAVGLVAVLELFAGSLRLTGKASHRTQAVIHAQNVMDGFFAPGFLEDGEESGELPDGFFWRARVQEIFPDETEEEAAERENDALGGEASLLHIKEITVSVGWGEGESQRSFELRSMRLMYEEPDSFEEGEG